MEIDKGIIVEKLDIKDGDTLFFTLDPEFWTSSDIQDIADLVKKYFPNNKVFCKVKGIDVEVEKNGIDEKTS